MVLGMVQDMPVLGMVPGTALGTVLGMVLDMVLGILVLDSKNLLLPHQRSPTWPIS